jgi:hypothetical protein
MSLFPLLTNKTVLEIRYIYLYTNLAYTRSPNISGRYKELYRKNRSPNITIVPFVAAVYFN